MNDRADAAPGRILALPLIAIVLAVLVGSVVIIFSEWLITGQLEPGLADRRLRRPDRGLDRQSERAIVNTLVATAPLLLGGLSVGLAFKAGLFNIGAQGQFLMGALGAVAVGVALRESPGDRRHPRCAGGRDGRSGRSGASSRASSRRSRAPTRS